MYADFSYGFGVCFLTFDIHDKQDDEHDHEKDDEQ
jgi:hypothetical protein